MAVKLTKQEKDYLKSLPDGKEIIEAEERLTTFYLDYQLILYWIDGVSFIIALALTVVKITLSFINGHSNGELAWYIFLITRTVVCATHLSGVLSAKLKRKRLLLLTIALAFLEEALLITTLVLQMLPDSSVNQVKSSSDYILVFGLQGIFTDAALILLRIAFFIHLYKLDKAGRKRSQRSRSSVKLASKAKPSKSRVQVSSKQ